MYGVFRILPRSKKDQALIRNLNEDIRNIYTSAVFITTP